MEGYNYRNYMSYPSNLLGEYVNINSASLGLYSTSRLYFIIGEIAMRARERHENDLAEEWNLSQEKSCGSLQ